MTKRDVVTPNHTKAMTVEELRSKIFEDKAAYRSHLASTPILEKLRILEEMRDFTAAMQHARDENKALVSGAWVKSELEMF